MAGDHREPGTWHRKIYYHLIETFLTHTSFSPDRSVVVVHGPQAFDEGDVAFCIAHLSPREVIVAGVMARTAAEESGIVCSCPGRPPSEISALRNPEGGAFLLNRGKNPESGEIFGEIVAGRLGAHRGLIHVECAAETVFVWNNGDSVLAKWLADVFSYRCEHRETASHAGCLNQQTRTIRGCVPGEPVFVNGIVIGQATDTSVTLRIDENGEVFPIEGITPKPHGLEKLRLHGPVTLETAWCKSGTVRSQAPRLSTLRRTHGTVAIVDHAGTGVYDQINETTCGVLSIGDDTTAVCGHICSHLGIPVFGVVDGDRDAVIEPYFGDESLVVEIMDRTDDEAGRMLATTIDVERSYCWSELTEQLLREIPAVFKIVVDTRAK